MATPPIASAPRETGFEAVARMFRAPEFDQLPRGAAKDVLGNALVSLDREHHRIRRTLENRLFAPEALQRYEHEVLRPHMERAFAALSVDADGRAQIDVPEFATQLILNIGLALIGIDQREPDVRRHIRSFIEPLIAAHEIEWTTDDPTERIQRALKVKQEYWDTYLEPAYRRRQAAIAAGTWDEPADLLSILAEAGDIDDETVGQEAGLYIVASVLTTTATITDATELLLEWFEEHPEDRERALDPEDDFLLNAIEESLRVRPPVKPVVSRMAVEETSIGGVALKPGDMAGIGVVEANVDPAVYPDRPETFLPHRRPAIETRRTHFSFGDGTHLCIGRPLVVGDKRAGTVGDAVMVVRALLERDVRRDPNGTPRLAPTSRRRYVSYPATVEPTRRVSRALPVRVAETRMVGDHTRIVALEAVDGALPPFTAGAHIDVAVPGVGNRSYSLAGDPEGGRYLIAVRREEPGRGGSAWMLAHAQEGATLEIMPPRNNFPLDDEGGHALLIAGGIGVTPLLAMIHRLNRLGRPWTLSYLARTEDRLVLLDEVRALAGAHGEVRVHATEGRGRPALGALLDEFPDSAVYACGPLGMLRELQALGERRGREVRMEFFENTAAKATERAYEVELASTGDRVQIPKGRTILEVLIDRGMDMEFSCSEGTCGTCEVRVLRGRPDHRDAVLSAAERAAGKSLMICCSGSEDPVLVLDL